MKKKKKQPVKNQKVSFIDISDDKVDLKAPKRIRTLMICIFTVFLLLIGRLGFLQFVQGSSLKEQAYRQQTVNRLISPTRGNILDATGKTLATSASVDTVSVNPTKIKGKTAEETKAKKEKIAKAFSEIFELNYDETLEKLNSTSSVQTIAKKVENDKIEQLKSWMKDNDISAGINIDEDTKRYYPYNNLASHVIGFTGDDNQGLYGIEQKWDNSLAGTPRKNCNFY